VKERDDRSTASLRKLGTVSLFLGAAGVMILMIRAGGPNRPMILVPLFAVWDISPFVLLWVIDRFGVALSTATRIALYVLMLLVAIGSVAYYVADAISPRPAQAAFPYVIAPPVAWLLTACVLGATAIFSRKS
jgi:hypothetical protein